MHKLSAIILLSGILFFNSYQSFSQNSVLSTGVWYKLSVAEEGVYCITRSDLAALGINVSTVNPQNISIYGNKSGMLPLKNNVPHADDLKEIAITVKGEVDGIFDAADTIFFYGQSQDQRIANLNSHQFTHRKNIYSDSTYYFLTVGTAHGKRIQTQQNLPANTNSTSTYTDFIWHEKDSVNVLRSGKTWYGEKFELQTASRTFNFDVSHIAANESLFIRTEIAGRTFFSGSSSFEISSNGISSTKSIASVGSSPADPYANISIDTLVLSPPVSNGSVLCTWHSLDSFSVCFLNHIELNFISNLEIFRSQQLISDLNSVGPGNITKYTIANAPSTLQIWDVTDPVNVYNQLFNSSFPVIDFNANNDSVHTYLTFDRQTFLVPHFIGQVANQNLHSYTQADYVFITADEFLSEATTLANFHQSHDGLTPVVVTASQVYNEYSSGSQDPVAVRDFIRQIFSRSAAVNDSLKYVLFFGCGSYDYRGRTGSLSSFVPTYQTDQSLNQTQSIAYDEFFGYMNDTAADYWSNRVEIGIGRIPARNHTEALAINKIMNYNAQNTIGDWRKKVTMVADDGAQNVFFKQMDTLSNRLENNYCEYDIRKIYVDSYIRDTTGGLIRYPDVYNDIRDNIQNGTLAIHYTGFGGEYGWAHERVLDTIVLQNASNNNNLPLFLNATAEINRFDDPLKNSCGKIISLNNSGGGIASISNTRISFSSSDNNFYNILYKHLFDKENNQYLRLGDILKKTKQDYRDLFTIGYCLLGDPATKLNYPEHSVVTTAFNGHAVSSQTDTLLPGQSIQLDGQIEDGGGNVVSTFNGTVNIVVFDQKTLHYTLANNTIESVVAPFYAWDDTLSVISTAVTNGVFSTTFNLPWDIDSGFGVGKISYYAQDGNTDASGCFQNLGYLNLTPGVAEIPGANVSLFPNPASDRIEFEIKDIDVNEFYFSISDITGKRLRGLRLTVENLL